MQLPQAGSIGASTQASQEQDELTQRLARLRQAEWLSIQTVYFNIKYAMLSIIIIIKNAYC